MGEDFDLPGAAERWVGGAAGASADQMTLLRELGERLARRSVDVEAVVQWLSERVSVLYAAGCVVVLLDESGTAVVVSGAHHPEPEARAVLRGFTGQRWPADEGFFARLADTRMPLLVTDVDPDAFGRIRPEFAPYLSRVGVSSAVFLPLRARGRVLGVLAALRSSPAPPFEPSDQCFLEEVADHLAVGIDAHRLSQALERRRSSDGAAVAGPAGHADDDDDLSAREREVLDLLARGYTNRQVAERLFLSVRTVEWHRERIQTKLGISGRAALVGAARERGLGG